MPRNLDYILRWAKAKRPDMIEQIEQMMELDRQRDPRAQAMLFLLTMGFEGGRLFERDNGNVAGGIGYSDDIPVEKVKEWYPEGDMFVSAPLKAYLRWVVGEGDEYDSNKDFYEAQQELSYMNAGNLAYFVPGLVKSEIEAELNALISRRFGNGDLKIYRYI